MRCHEFSDAILRRPGRSVTQGLRDGGGPDPDYAGVLAEHDAYAEALAAAGVRVQILDPLEEFPDAVFVEDPALVFGEAAILLNPGAASRAGEAALLAPVLEARFPQVIRLAQGHADGGDVMVTPDCVLIGLSARTDAVGAEALVAALATIGRKARVVTPPEGALHLKTISSMIDEETILTTAEGAASGLFAGFRTIALEPGEETAANALRVNDTLLLPAGSPRIAERLDREGYPVRLLDTTNIARIDAGLSCMSLRWMA